jgi:hypothetical protein
MNNVENTLESIKKLISNPYALKSTISLMVFYAAITIYSLNNLNFILYMGGCFITIIFALINYETKVLYKFNKMFVLHFILCMVLITTPSLIEIFFNVETKKLGLFTSVIALGYWWFYLENCLSQLKKRYKSK